MATNDILEHSVSYERMYMIWLIVYATNDEPRAYLLYSRTHHLSDERDHTEFGILVANGKRKAIKYEGVQAVQLKLAIRCKEMFGLMVNVQMR